MTRGCDDSRVGEGREEIWDKTMSSKFLSPESVLAFRSVPFGGTFIPTRPTWRGAQLLRTGPPCTRALQQLG